MDGSCSVVIRLITSKTVALILLAILLAVAHAEAQIIKGTFIGTIRDASGAVVPKAKVTAKNLATNVANTVTTDETGSYIVPFLDNGTYSVSAESPGFKTAVEPSVKLDVAAKVRVDLTLEVGPTTETVEVVSAAPLIETDTSNLGLVVTSEKLRQLPLLGRNYQALSQLAPTAVSPVENIVTRTLPALTVGNYYQVAGQRGSFISYGLDGIDANQLYVQSPSLIPSLDSIGEFKVQTQNFSAEYGRGTVQFTSTTRQGTNTVHGSAYEYLRNDALDANAFFLNKAGQKKGAYRYNQFGFTVGGPIFLPKVYNGKNKSFFFFGYEGTRFVTKATSFARWPQPEWLQGDFTSLRKADGSPALVYDPATTRPDGRGSYLRDPFPNNRIPSGRFDPVSVALFPYFPKPGSRTDIPGQLANTVGITETRSNPNFWILRLDHNFSNSDRLYGRYMQSLERYTRSSLAPLSGQINTNRGRNVMLAETHVFSPSVFNEARLGFNRAFYGSLQEGADGECLTTCSAIDYVKDVFRLKNLGGGSITWGLPQFSFTGYTAFGGPTNAPLRPLTNAYQASDNLIMNFGRHALKTGLDVRYQQYNAIYGTSNRGGFSFAGTFTRGITDTTAGSPFGDFLLGISSTALGLSGEASGHFRSTIYGFYFQDDWRVSSRLTLNLGWRYEYYTPWTEQMGRATRFELGFIPGSCFGSNCPPGRIVTFKPGERYYDPDRNNWAPRVGLSWAPFGGNRTVVRAAYGIFYSPSDATDQVNSVFNPPTALNVSITPQNPFTDLTSTKLSEMFPGGKMPDPSLLVTNKWPLPPLQLFTLVSGHMPDPVVQEWQLTIQREIRPNLLLELGYVGSHVYNGQRRVNYGQARLDRPGELTPLASRLPYPSLSGFQQWVEHTSQSTYNAGTLRLERRFERGLSFLGAYTWAKTLDDYGNLNDLQSYMPQYSYNKKIEKGLSGFHAAHRFTAGYVWEVPFGKGRHWGSSIHPVLDAFVGGWQVSGITTFQTGNTLRTIPSYDTSNTGELVNTLRANQVGPVRYLDIRKTGYWFNDDAFQEPSLGSIGTAARGALMGPGINNWDLMIGKEFRITETSRLQFRTEMFNAFNHAQFTSVFGTISPTFKGRIGQVSGTRAPRSIQLALRFEF